MRSFRLLASWRWCVLAFLAVGCAHSSASAPVESSPPEAEWQSSHRKEEKVRKLMVLTGAEDTGRRMLDSMTQHFGEMSNIPSGFLEKFREVAAQEPIVELLVPVYMNHFSEEDLDAAIAFHESPAGKRFLAAQPLVMQEAMQLGEQWGLRLAEKTLRALAEEERELRHQRVSSEGQQL
ncbi:DUF2059 domain-containing protein [Archangium lipolyticum]|uniref:DUF2059 domain-containing protein n=1 Tax=Archangium lipolyticum TaxID=2970465 RepID=UPI00214A1650|nr:DUF2059 domain-containing protein [Archangium lipolyticum]